MIGAAWAWVVSSRVGRYVALAVGLLAAGAIIYLRGRSEGRKAAELARHRFTERRTKDARKAADKVRRDLGDADDDDLDKRLRDAGL